MYHNLINQNPLISQFNGYISQNPNTTPFQNNQLINQNPHVINNLNQLVHQHKMVQQNTKNHQQTMPNITDKTPVKNINVIEEMLKPYKITKNNWFSWKFIFIN